MPASIFGLETSPNHFAVTSLGDGRTQVIGSRFPAKCCIVFVHGFNGKALDTWKGFDTLALQNAALEETDLIFFGYDGLRSNALASASFLFDLVDDALGAGRLLKPVKTVPPAYGKCVIAAHSLGAVVTRWVLLRAYHEKRLWLDKISYLLFAPAHCGGVVVDSVSELLDANVLTKLLGNAAKASLPLLNELAPDSTILKTLQEQTRAAIDAGCSALRAKRVVIAEYEQVVSNLPFPGDRYPTAIRDASHTTVCKPEQYRDVINFVVELLE
jgi:triacylglycerol esterase/lipase EstA (alpha/beta hydrolase family)